MPKRFILQKKIWISSIFIIILVFSYLCIQKGQEILSQGVNSWVEDQVADCAVVLTGGPNRIREGFDLLSHKQVQKLIISGVHPQSELKDIFPLMPYYPELRKQDIVLEKRSHSTYGNAQQSLPLVQALHCRDIILITGRLHMHRALKTFQSEFPSSINIYSRAVLSSNLDPGLMDLGFEVIKSFFYDLWAY